MKSFRLAFLLAMVMGIGSSARAQCSAPYDIPKFQAAIAECKLQAPTSSTAATQAQLIAGYCSDWFKVADTDKMAFNQTGDSMRTELRYLNNWFINATNRSAHASINIVTQTCDQVTVLQIHDDAGAGSGPNKPLLRIYRHLNKTPVNHIWAAIKTDSVGVNTEHVDLGLTPAGYWDCDIVIAGGNMSVAINGTTLVTRDVSFWTFPSYWKAGVYLQDPGEATAFFDELTWTEGTPQYTLTTHVVGQGSIGLNPAGGTYTNGTVVTVTAAPDTGWQFDGWSGDLSGSLNPEAITMDANKTVTGTFSVINQPPAFTSDPINEITATEGVAYNSTIADNASDPEGDPMTFSKTGGPGWLNVATNGVLSGTPGTTNVGANVFTVQVDATGGSDSATLNITVNAAGGGGSVTNCIADDSWSSGTRTSPPNDASYWSSVDNGANSIEVYTNELGLISGTSGRGNHAIFASQALAIGETLIATLSFTTPATVGNDKSDALRFGLFDTTGHLPGLEADLSASSASPNTNFNNLNGYMVAFDVDNGSDDVRLYERDNPGSGRLMATVGDYSSLGNGGSSYTFLANTNYTVKMALTRVAAAELSLVGSLYQGATLLSTHTESDTSATATEFGMLGMHANSSTFGSTTSSGQGVDNGLTFSNIQICLVTAAPTPPPTLGITLSGPNNVILSWPTNGSSGFNLESTATMSTPGWSLEGSPTIVGDQYQVTIPATNNETYYRLKKP